MNVSHSTPISSDEEAEEVKSVHPLSPYWTLWVRKVKNDDSHDSDFAEQLTVQTIEQFFGAQYRIIPPSQLKSNIDYAYFKKGITPFPDDMHNSRGGMWMMEIEKKHKLTKLDKVWNELLVAIIGAQFDPYNRYINGAVLENRDEVDRLSIWVNDASNKKINYEIRDYITEKLGLLNPEAIVFKRHMFISEKTMVEFR